jgi:hypothetical protein
MPSKPASKRGATKPSADSTVKAPNKGGRPSPASLTPEFIDTICDRIAGGESLRGICEDEDMPHRRTVERWLMDDATFAARYAHAREVQGDLMDERQMAIAKKVEAGLLGAPEARVIVGVLQWRAAKLAPKRYGEKLNLEHSGEIELNDTQLDARITASVAALAAALGQARGGSPPGDAGGEGEA